MERRLASVDQMDALVQIEAVEAGRSGAVVEYRAIPLHYGNAVTRECNMPSSGSIRTIINKSQQQQIWLPLLLLLVT
jgi:hypothetical protein